MHSHKAKPDKINDKHGSSLPSINECFGLLCYTFRQKALLRNSSLSPRRFLTGVAMEYVLRYVSASPFGTASAPDLISPRFPWLLLPAILSQTLCGYAFKTHISSSPNRRDSFII